MLLVIAKFRALPGQRERVVSIAEPCIEATRKEEGCIDYELFAAVEDGEGLVFLEKWRSRADLDLHQQSEHIARFKEARTPYVEGPSRVEVFEV